MNRTQKIAWFLVVVILLSVITSVCVFILLYMRNGMPKASAGFSFLAIAAIGAFSPLIFGKDKGKVTCDERDKSINRYAALAGFGSAYLFVGLACMIPFSFLGPTATISVTWLPMIFGGTFLSSVFVRSLAILVQYGWRDKENE